MLKELLPTTSHFATLIDEGSLYVDKIELIAKLTARQGQFLLTRPHGFGKTLLLTALSELFAHGTKRFAGLKLGKEHLWQDKTYTVLQLNLNEAASLSCCSTAFVHNFADLINTELKALTGREDALRPGSWQEDLHKFLHSIKPRSLVLLIDDFDRPLSAVFDLEDSAEFKARRAVLLQFLTVLNCHADKLRFVLIAGTLQILKHSELHSLNKLTDLSFSPGYGAIAGITAGELEQCFKEHLKQAAAEINAKAQAKAQARGQTAAQSLSAADVLAGLKRSLSASSFDNKGAAQVLNPAAVIKFFRSPSGLFMPRGVRTDPAFAARMVRIFKSSDPAANSRLRSYLGFLDRTYTARRTLQELTAPLRALNDPDFSLPALLCQEGFLTIRQAKGGETALGIASLERQTALGKILLTALADDDFSPARGDRMTLNPLYYKARFAPALAQAFKSRDTDKIKALFEQIKACLTAAGLKTAC
ncbi:MAG: AAA family ATPase [Proteobacteria bacterium]|uniref:AAA family ATPase n=1 Tax=Candidatus Avisuccinivibrio stercorigallinarum TaxID=2840704 RepID=A0A9D9DBJ3_9GAMM|nr:AAA family ATPase [Candidatus Avisuccinivibrio stercorigallinarum]